MGRRINCNVQYSMCIVQYTNFVMFFQNFSPAVNRTDTVAEARDVS